MGCINLLGRCSNYFVLGCGVNNLMSWYRGYEHCHVYDLRSWWNRWIIILNNTSGGYYQCNERNEKKKIFHTPHFN